MNTEDNTNSHPTELCGEKAKLLEKLKDFEAFSKFLEPIMNIDIFVFQRVLDVINNIMEAKDKEIKEMIEKLKEQISDRIWKDITLADKTKHPEKMDNLHNDIMNLIDDVSKK